MLRVLPVLVLLAWLPACGIKDCSRNLFGPDVECPDVPEGTRDLALKTVNDEMGCAFFETALVDLVEGGPVWIEQEPFGIQAVGGHPCHLASHDRAELETIVHVLSAPEGLSIALGEDHFVDGEPRWKAYLLDEPALITGADVERARVSFNEPISAPVVMVHLTDEAARVFETLTDENRGRRLAIVVDGEVVSAPRIQERIPGGKIQITLGSSGPHDEIYCEAQALASALGNE